VKSVWRDYYVIIASGESRLNWRWEIKRRSEPMGVRLTGDSYSSQKAAEEAGRHALAEFLAAIAYEGCCT
jgi:allophanate hydrolase subunit 2